MTDPTQRLAELGDRYLHLSMTAHPFTASLLGLPGYDDLVPDPRPEATQDLVRDLRSVAVQARALSDLSAPDSVTRAVLVRTAADDADRAELREVEFQTAPFWSSVHSQLLSILPKVRLTDSARAEAYLARLRKVPGYLDAAGEQLRTGTARGRTAAARSLARSIAALDAHLSGAVADDVLLAPDWEDEAWRRAREAVVRDLVRPALGRLRDLYRDELAPAARPDDQVGVSWLPDGSALYGVLARAHTTTALTPPELHELGLAELARLDEEYAALGQVLFGTSDVDSVLARMRNDPGLRLRNADELLTRSRTALERAHKSLPNWFGLLPPSGCDLQLVPEQEAVNSAPAYYSPPDDATGRLGTYWVNAHEVEKRPTYDVEAIAFHEALPGHHLQLSIAQQLNDLPLFRRVNISSGYTEGWGLYSERLADEMGLYSSDLDRLGMLSCDSWRACRLVIDSGIHALGWSFQQSVDFMQRRTALPLSVIEPEIDRYVGMPGQALSYMVGRLEIVRMRKQAERVLGERFDLRDFHDEVLRGGSLPLSVLESQLDAWTAAH